MGDPYITPAIPQTKARGQLSICPRHGQELVGESPLGWSAGQTMGHSGVPDGNQHEVGQISARSRWQLGTTCPRLHAPFAPGPGR